MNEILLQVLKLIIMIAVVVIIRYIVPALKSMIDSSMLDAAMQWVESTVMYAQQVKTSNTGAEKKAIVTEFLREILTAKNISISEEELDVLIEAAVKQMKIEENAGIVIEAADGIEAEE